MVRLFIARDINLHVQRLSAELMSRSDFSKSEAEQFVQTFEEMTNKLTVKEEDLRVLKIELDQKSKQLTELTNEVRPDAQCHVITLLT